MHSFGLGAVEYNFNNYIVNYNALNTAMCEPHLEVLFYLFSRLYLILNYCLIHIYFNVVWIC